MHRKFCTFSLLAGLALVPLSSTPVHAQGTPVENADEAQKIQAQEKFMEGKRAFDSNDFETALTAFKASYDVVASPNAHLMVARTLEGLGRKVEAYREAKATLEEAERAAGINPKYQQTVSAAQDRLAALRAKVAIITVNVVGAPDDAGLSVAGSPIERSQWGTPVAAPPGPIKVVLASSQGNAVREVRIEAGGQDALTLRADEPAAAPVPAMGETPMDEPEPDEDGDDSGANLRLAAYVSGGVGALGLVTFAIFGAMHASKHGDLEDSCPGGVCPPDRQGDIDDGQTFQTVANVGFAVGMVGLAAGTTLFILSQPELTFSAKLGESGPNLAVGPGSVTVKGSF
jgi:hypothetical protein